MGYKISFGIIIARLQYTYILFEYIWVLPFLIVNYVFIKAMDMDQRATKYIVKFYCGRVHTMYLDILEYCHFLS